MSAVKTLDGQAYQVDYDNGPSLCLTRILLGAANSRWHVCGFLFLNWQPLMIAEELVSALRAKIAKATGWPVEEVRIIFAGKALEDDRTVGAYVLVVPRFRLAAI